MMKTSPCSKSNVFESRSWLAAGWLLVLSPVLLLPLPTAVNGGPLNIEGPSSEVANNSLLTDFDLPSPSKGCRYKALFYNNGEEVSTDEPCLACQCKGTVVVCKLRICPETPVPPPPGCIVVHKAKSCCSQLVCHNQENFAKKISREQRFPSSIAANEGLMGSGSNDTSKESAGYCVLDGTVYAEGSAMRSSTLCQYCFCIRNEMKCSSPQCVIPLNGCKPKFRSYACCPTNYDCGQSNETAVLKTIPSSTQVPQFLKGCLVNNQFVPEGEPVLPVQLTGFANSSSAPQNSICQTCFCMGGVVHCRPLECDQPIDGCEPIKEDGHCCPDRYDCSKRTLSSSKQKATSTTATTMKTTTIPVSSIVAMMSTTALPASSVTTTLAPQVDDQEEESEALDAGGVTTEAYIKNRYPYSEGYYVPVAITMMEEGQENLETTTAAVTNEKPKNGDSFERVGTIVTGSSEEDSGIAQSTTPPQYEEKNQHTQQQPSKKTRVSATTVGGFKNRSDLGSREERRSKDGDEMSLMVNGKPQEQQQMMLQQSTEDDEREDDYLGGVTVFETTMSNTIEELGGATTLYKDGGNMEESTSGPDVEADLDISSAEATSDNRADSNENLPEIENTTDNNHISEQDHFPGQFHDTTILPRSLTADEDVTNTGVMGEFTEETTEKATTTATTNATTTTTPPAFTDASSSSTTPPAAATTTFVPTSTEARLTTTTTKVPMSTTNVPTVVSSSTSGDLEFIPFVEEDAFVPLDDDSKETKDDVENTDSVELETNSHETDTFDKISEDVAVPPESTMSLLKPLLLKFFNGTTQASPQAQSSVETEDSLPILVENDVMGKPSTEFNLDHNHNTSRDGKVPPVSSSLYNNGFYPHGSIITDDDSPAEELHVSQGELSSGEKESSKLTTEDDETEDDEVNQAFQKRYQIKATIPSTPSTTSTTTTSTTTTAATKKPEQPLKAISSIDKFIPSYAPATVPQTQAEPLDNKAQNPSRTYSKFGIQDAPLYRFDQNGASASPGENNNGFNHRNGMNSNGPSSKPLPTGPAVLHHRYYNEPEEIPTSRIQSPYNYYSTSNTNNNPTGSSSSSSSNKRPQPHSGMGMLPQLYKNNQFFYEDSSAAMDSYEDDYDTILPSPSSAGSTSNSILPTSPGSVTPRSSSGSSSTSTPRSGSHFQFLGERVRLPSYNQQRATSTPKYKYAHFNNRKGTTPFQRFGSTERTPSSLLGNSNGDYSSNKHFQSPFPFNLPRSQDSNLLKNLGIKLSGCNVVGKMYSVGEIIEELSSDCLTCLCSDIGVHCAERKC